jgi:hypothetical protein
MTRLFGFKKERPDEKGITSNLDDDSSEEIRGLSSLYFPEEDSTTHIRDVAVVLSEMGKITDEQLAEIRQIQGQKPDCDIAEIIKDGEFADEPEISTAQANLYGFEFQRVELENVDREAFDKLEPVYIKNNYIMPIAIEGQGLTVATSRPADLMVIEDVKRLTQMEVEVVVCPEEDIHKVCEAFEEEKGDYLLDDIISDMTDVEVVQDEEKKDFEDLEKMAGQSPVIYTKAPVTSILSQRTSSPK